MVAIKNMQTTDPIAFVKATVRIEDYVQINLAPVKRRANELWFLCPFHQENTPSFHVRIREQDFKCFGCGKGGDVIDFDMAATGETNPRTAAERILREYGYADQPDELMPEYGVGSEPVKVRPMRKPGEGERFETAPTLTDAAIAWLNSRGISTDVARRNRVRGLANAVTFDYRHNGEIINRQKRTLSTKHFRFEAGKPVIPFGLDDVIGRGTAIIVEGVMDKLSVEEATGETAVLAMPSANPSGDCYALACEALESAERIIIAVDNDESGEKLRDELARRLGADRCWLVDWLDLKDANDVLTSVYGAEGLRHRIAEAKPIPVEGVFTVDDSWAQIERLYDEGMPRGASTGWPALDRYYTVRRQQLTVITGTPGSGKSVWADALLMNLAKSDWNWTFAICSPEMQPLERHWAHLIGLWAGKPFGNGPTPRLDRETLRQAKAFLHDRFYMLLPEEPTVDAVIDRFLWTHRRHGVSGLLLDPWNELDHSRPNGMTETEYCNQALRQLKRIGWHHDVWIGLIAHPTKLYRNKQDGSYPIPTLYDINGSAAFANKADNGIVIWRDKADETRPVEVHVQKVRFHEIGGLGMVRMTHDRLTGRYHEAMGV